MTNLTLTTEACIDYVTKNDVIATSNVYMGSNTFPPLNPCIIFSVAAMWEC